MGSWAAYHAMNEGDDDLRDGSTLSDLTENTICSNCGGPLPEGKYDFCCSLCRSAALADMMEDLQNSE